MTVAACQGGSIQKWKYWHDNGFDTQYIYWFIISNFSGSICPSITNTQMHLFSCQSQKSQGEEVQILTKNAILFICNCQWKMKFYRNMQRKLIFPQALHQESSRPHCAFQAVYTVYTTPFLLLFFILIFKIWGQVLM